MDFFGWVCGVVDRSQGLGRDHGRRTGRQSDLLGDPRRIAGKRAAASLTCTPRSGHYLCSMTAEDNRRSKLTLAVGEIATPHRPLLRELAVLQGAFDWTASLETSQDCEGSGRCCEVLQRVSA